MYQAGYADADINSGIVQIEPIAENKVLVYPNPSNEYINISSMNDNNQILIYNTFGELVYQDQVRGEKHIQLSTSQFSSGVYLLHVNGQVQKIIVTH